MLRPGSANGRIRGKHTPERHFMSTMQTYTKALGLYYKHVSMVDISYCLR